MDIKTVSAESYMIYFSHSLFPVSGYYNNFERKLRKEKKKYKKLH